MYRTLIISAAALAAACSHAEPPRETVRPVKVIVAAHASHVDKDFAGMATADDAVNLAFKIAGQVSSVDVSKGESVARGALLAQLNPRDVELQVASARSAYEEADAQFARMQRLLAHEAVSRQEFESARTRYTQAKSAYDNSVDVLADTKLRAPFAGVVERTYVDTYERVQSGQTIVRLVNPVSTTVGFTIPENALPAIADPATRFYVEFDNYRGVRFDAVLKDYARTSSDAYGFPASLRLVGVDASRYDIIPGMSCTVTMQSGDDVPSAVALPLTAICAPAEGGTYVWTLSDGRVHRRAVVLGEIFGRDEVIVESGVEPGDTVVTAGVYRLSEGERVKILAR